MGKMNQKCQKYLILVFLQKGKILNSDQALLGCLSYQFVHTKENDAKL